MTRVAAIDCGTNSIRLLVADAAADGTLTDIEREMRIVRLGQGVDATGTFAPTAIERTRVALEEFVGIIRSSGGVDRVRMVATSATRDASNRDDFFEMTAVTLAPVAKDAVAEVISGDEEARLSFSGAVGDLDAADGPFLVVDLGGGSTELVLGDTGGVTAAYSADVGCVRVTERCLHSDPPTAGEIAAARDFIGERFAPALATVPVKQARTWVGVAGTMTTIAALALDLPHYDRDRVHLSNFSFDDIDAICARLLGMTRAERAGLGPMHPGRVDVIGAGSLITATLAAVIAEESLVNGLTVSEHDILDGIAQSIVG